MRKDQALSAPTLDEVSRAAKRLGYRVETEHEIAHPSRHWKTEGRVLVVGGGKKTDIIRSVAREMRSQRS